MKIAPPDNRNSGGSRGLQAPESKSHLKPALAAGLSRVIGGSRGLQAPESKPYLKAALAAGLSCYRALKGHHFNCAPKAVKPSTALTADLSCDTGGSRGLQAPESKSHLKPALTTGLSRVIGGSRGLQASESKPQLKAALAAGLSCFRALKGHDFNCASKAVKPSTALTADLSCDTGGSRGLQATESKLDLKAALAAGLSCYRALKGHDFSRAAKATQPAAALAAEGTRNPIHFTKSNHLNRTRRILWPLLLLPLLIAASCRSYIVHITVVNRTGTAVNQLEVDYPSASFGVDTLPSGAVYQYRVQLQDSGPIKVQYTEGEKQQYKSSGPTVHEKQQGDLEIILNPNGKTEFHPNLNPPN